MIRQRIGIIDIGSNSVRLVVYERTENGAHRVIDGSKRSSRLSERIDENGCLISSAIDGLMNTLSHFTKICSYHHVNQIRTVATAAIRNAANQTAILERIQSETGLAVELLSGTEEASYGFLGMINSLNLTDGFLIDIGGGSTELSLFRDRTLLHSISLPFGCVSLKKQFDSEGQQLNDETLKALEAHVASALKQHPWIQEAPGLPLVGVGGTARALGKMHQAAHQYPFTQIHNYKIANHQVDELFQTTRKLPLEKMRKLPGLSKDRADVIVPGIAVFRLIYRTVRAIHYQICGAGLRDGLFHATYFPDRPKLDDPLAYSLNNISSLHNDAPRQHVLQVNRLALKLFDCLVLELPEQARTARTLLDTASRLFRIGASIDYYEYSRHSFYLIIHSHLNGLSHREIIMTAAIASYKSKGRAKQQLAEYKDMLGESDLELICMLGMLLQLAAALDRSETQAIDRLTIRTSEDQKLLIHPLEPRDTLAVEGREVDELAAEFNKLWGVTPVLEQSK